MVPAALQKYESAVSDTDVAPPPLPIKGGDLIAMGLPPGPIVAATLQAIERAWARAGFPGEEETRALARAQVDQALRALK